MVLSLRAGESFVSARKRLIKQGWEPITLHVTDDWGYYGVQNLLVKRKIYEVESCSMDSARCILYYKKSRKCLRVDTIGETVEAMEVTRWTQECPKPEDYSDPKLKK